MLGEPDVVDLTALTYTYVTVVMLLSMAGEGVPPGQEPPSEPGD
ncbi:MULTISPECIES: hypothetical protein [Methylobacterium]|nr:MULTISPECIES: hypothetical protein [Methylobacterium]MDE3750298.1 hypothetical protein [Methylobacterium radiotolerans]